MTNNYDVLIKPRFDEIEKWAKSGCTDETIYKALGVGKTAWFKYKKDKKELSRLIDDARTKGLPEAIEVLRKCAVGFDYFTDEAYKCKEVFYDENNRRCEKEELKTITVKKFYTPNAQLLMFFIMNRDKTQEWSPNPNDLKIKKAQLKIAKEAAANKDW